MKKKKTISNHTFKTFFDKEPSLDKKTSSKEREFIEKYSKVDALLDICLSSSNPDVGDQLCEGEKELRNLGKDCDGLIERLIPDSPPSKSSKIPRQPTPAVKEIQVGSVIDERYEVREYLAEGAFGEVYRGYHTILRIAIAIKTMKKKCLSGRKMRERFIFEAQVMANIQHPNIIRIYDVGELHGQLYLIMKYVDGIDLEKFIEQEEKLPPHMAIELMIQLSDALSVIHAKGIIHRDIKPSNIMIDQNGRPVLMDFGIAKGKLNESVAQKSLTAEGSFLGTPQYMAPEQFTNPEKVTMASDVYALGIVFFQLITREVPISGSTYGEIYQNHLNVGLPGVHTLFKGITPRISKVIAKMLAKNPGERYQDGLAVKNALQRAKASRAYTFVTIAAAITVMSLIGLILARTIITTKHERTRAKIQIADSLVSEGSGLADAEKWSAAKSKFSEAYNLYKRLGLSTFTAELGLWNIYRNSPSVLNSWKTDPPPLCLAISVNDKLMLSGDSQGTLILWDVRSGQKLSAFEESTDGVPKTCSAFSSDNNFAISGNFKGEISLWAVNNGDKIRSFGKKRSWLNKVIFSPNNQMALSADNEGSLTLWNVESGEVVHSLEGHKDAVRDIAFTQDGKLIISGGADGIVILWNVLSGEIERKFPEQKNEILAVASSSDTKLVAGGGCNGITRIWDIENSREVKTLVSHESPVLAVMFRNRSTSILAAQNDSTIASWEMTKERATNVFSGHFDSVVNLALSPSGKVVIASNGNNTINVQPTRPQGEVIDFVGHTGWITSANLSQDGTMAVSGSSDRIVKVWDLATGHHLQSFAGHKGSITSVFFTPDNLKVLSASKDGTLKLWNLYTRKVVRTFTGDHGPVRTADLAHDGRMIISGYADGTVVLWDITTGRRLYETKNFHNPIITATFSSDGQLALYAHKNGPLRIVNTKNFQEILQIDTLHLNTARFTPNSDFLAFAHNNGDFQLWDIKAKKKGQVDFGKQQGRITSIDFTNDGRYAISGGEDALIKFWDINTGHSISILKGHTRAITCVKHSLTKPQILSGSKDKTLKLCDFSRIPKHLAYETQLQEINNAVAVSPQDSQSLILLGEWYYFRGMWEWAIDCFSKAIDRGGVVSPVSLARCYWQSGMHTMAYQEFQRAREKGEAPEYYLELCMNALKNHM